MIWVFREVLLLVPYFPSDWHWSSKITCVHVEHCLSRDRLVFCAGSSLWYCSAHNALCDVTATFFMYFERNVRSAIRCNALVSELTVEIFRPWEKLCFNDFNCAVNVCVVLDNFQLTFVFSEYFLALWNSYKAKNKKRMDWAEWGNDPAPRAHCSATYPAKDESCNLPLTCRLPADVPLT